VALEPVYDILNCGPRRRFGANGKLVHNSNWQNFTNEDETDPDEPTLNKAIMAPDGWLIASPDASQIECRLLNELAGQTDVIENFRSGRDPYINVASAFYKRPITKADKDERQCGKVLELQCGFGSGGPKIAATLRIKTKGKIILDAVGGLAARDAYRDTHQQVVGLWRFADLVLKRMANFLSFEWGPMRVQCNVDRGTRRIVLPNGVQLIYDTLDWHVPDDVEIEKTGDPSPYWRLKTRHGWAKLYGAKLVENVIQALARVVVSQCMLRLKAMGYRTVSMKHDELWILIPRDGREEEHRAVLTAEMSRQLPWMPNVPLGAECPIGERYSK
jgi:DNA polymerase